MRSLQFGAFGDPDSLQLVNVQAPDPNDGQVTVAIEAAPLNPSDFLLIDGFYPLRPALPSPAGAEGAGRVIAVGTGVDRVDLGDQVLLLPNQNPGTWQDQVTLDQRFVVRVDREVDPKQLATVGINAATARIMLNYAPDLPNGSWVAQTAANSNLGEFVIAMAKRDGLRTVNVVRRADAIDAVRAAGGDVVLVSDESLPSELNDALEGAGLALVLDGVGGPVVNQLAAHLPREGSIVSFALHSGQPVALLPQHLIFKNLHLHGLWLFNWLAAATQEEIDDLYTDIIALVADGILSTNIAATYDLADWSVAISEARTYRRNGKILFVPQGQ